MAILAAGLSIKKKNFCMKYDWLNIRNKKLGFMPCQIGNPGVEKKAGMKVSKESANNERVYFGQNRQQRLTFFTKKKKQQRVPHK
jgi:hypothetical protein